MLITMYVTAMYNIFMGCYYCSQATGDIIDRAPARLASALPFLK